MIERQSFITDGDLGNPDNHASDISEAEDEPEDKTVDHSDISDDENPVLEQRLSTKAESSDLEEDQQSFAKKRPKRPSSHADSEDLSKAEKLDDSTDDGENNIKRPILASTVVRPPPPPPSTHPKVLESQVRKKKSKSYDYATKLVKLAIDMLCSFQRTLGPTFGPQGILPHPWDSKGD